MTLFLYIALVIAFALMLYVIYKTETAPMHEDWDVPAPLRSAGPSAPEFPQATIIHRPLGQRMDLKARQAKRKKARERRYALRLEREINALIGDVEGK